MRTLKFRAWDKTNKLMLEVISLHDTTECWLGQVAMRTFGKPTEQWHNFPDMVEIMQYTGLEDKNGKEIYEGDIVKILYTDWTSQEDFMIGNIEYKAPSFEINFSRCIQNPSYVGKRWGDDEFGRIHPGEHGWIEVVGNIYTSPGTN